MTGEQVPPRPLAVGYSIGVRQFDQPEPSAARHRSEPDSTTETGEKA